MRIGIDARFITHPQEGGFKTYTENLIHGLAAFDGENDYILYTDRPQKEAYSLGVNFRVKSVGGSGPLREQVSLPLAMARDRVEIAHFLCNTAPLLQRFPTVLTIHDIIPCLPYRKVQPGQGLKSKAVACYWRSVIPKAARRANRVITVSQSSRNDICSALKVPQQRVTVVPTGLHPDFRPIGERDEIEMIRCKYRLPDRFILGFVSSDPRKNSARLLAAASIVEARLPHVSLVLVCSSAEAKDMALDIASQRELPPPRLSLVEPMPRQHLAVVYSLAEALAFPSLYEGFGLPVIEAMACGTPVVTSNASSLPEVAGDAAVLVDPTDPKALADALVEVITDRTLRAQLVRRGTARAAEFSWRRTAKETIAVYEQVWGESRMCAGLDAAHGHVGRGTAR